MHAPIASGWTFRKVAHKGGTQQVEEAWLPATVPGCVHTDLLAAGKIGDPFYRLNEKDQQWIENEAWEYRTTLPVDAATLAHERVELVFAGLDTFAEVFVNGAPVLTADNMFRSWRADVKAKLKVGDNQILVRFASPIAAVKPAYDKLGYKLPAANDQGKEMVSMWARKAPYHYGWDWGPRFVTSGIWRPVALEAWDEARLDDVQVFQNKLEAGKVAELGLVARVVAARAGNARVTVAQPGGPTLGHADVALKVGVNDVKLGARIDKPELWWPAGLGPQRLYTLETRLATADGKATDARTTRIGLRTIEVVHERDAEGKSFFIKVNGAPVFMKGANWIPADSFVTRVTDERYRLLLQSAVDANMNMLRVWGGGIYEDDRFYELADELGLLVWQDFMFACSMYPGDDPFVENVRHEAIENVRRLRNHPSLALWAGNNENEAAWKQWGWQIKFVLNKKAQDRIWADYKRVFHEVLPAVVAAEDPGRFYTRSSPSANDDKVPPNKKNWGDMHFWGVWHAENPYEAYGDNISRFMSEYGFQSFPDLASVKRYTAPDGSDWNIESPVMLSHQRHPRGNPLIRTYMERDFRKPKDFASFLYVGQVLQGDRHQVRRGGAPARDGPQLGQPLLAARRLLAGRFVVQHRLLRALEGGAVLRAQVLRARAGQPGDREGRRVDLGRLRSPRRRARAVDRATDRLRGQHADPLRAGRSPGREREPATYMTFKESDVLKGATRRRSCWSRSSRSRARPPRHAQPALLQEDEGPRSCRSRRSSSRSRPARTARSPSTSARSSSRATSSSPAAPSTGCSTTTTSTCCRARP